MNLKNYFEYKKDSLSSQKSEFLNVLNKLEITTATKVTTKTQSFNLFFLNKYFVGGLASASIAYIFLFYFVLQSSNSATNLVIKESDIKIEYIDNALNILDDNSNAFK